MCVCVYVLLLLLLVLLLLLLCYLMILYLFIYYLEIQEEIKGTNSLRSTNTGLFFMSAYGQIQRMHFRETYENMTSNV